MKYKSKVLQQKKYFLSFLILLSFNLMSLNLRGEGSKNDTSIIYIRKFHEYFYVKALVTQKIFTLSLTDNYIPGFKMDFKPNLGSYLGFGVFMFDLGVDLSFRLPQSQEQIDLYGKTKGLDFQLHVYTRKHGVDFSYQDYTGFYLSNPSDYYPLWKPGEPYPHQADMTARNIHLGTYYVFRSNRFSFPSIFNQTEAQLKSGGSWLMSGHLNLSDLKDPVSIVPVVDSNQFRGLMNLRNVSVFTIAALPGYSYNIIIRKKFYINLSLALGLGYQVRSYSTEELYRNNSLSLANTWRIGGGYNGRRLFFGFTGYGQQTNIQIENLNISTLTGFTRFFLGYRFREWGIFQKSVFDLFRSKNK